MIIYEAYNIQTKKRYIGMTSESFNKRKNVHYHNAYKAQLNLYFYRSLRKYGWNNFKWRIVGKCNSRNELNEAEKICIEFYQSNNFLYGYNMTIGGDGFSGVKRKESNLKTSVALIGIRRSRETRKKMSESKKGKLLSVDHKKSISEGMRGKKRKPCSEETKQKIRVANLGLKRPQLSIEARLKISDKTKEQWKLRKEQGFNLLGDK